MEKKSRCIFRIAGSIDSRGVHVSGVKIYFRVTWQGAGGIYCERRLQG